MSSSAIALTVATMRGSSAGRKRTSGISRQRGVERVGVVVLDEDAALVDAVLADVGVDLVGGRLPALGALVVLAQAREARAAVAGDPAHDLRRREVLGLAAHLPDAAVGLAPVRDRVLDLLARGSATSTRAARRATSCAGRSSRAARPRRRAAAGRRRRCRPAPAARPRSRRGGRACARSSSRLAADPVHDLQARPSSSPATSADEVEEVVGLPVEAERVEAPEHERRVADPRVAVVPVALAAGRLGQRRRRRGDHRAGRRVGQALERQRAALQVGRATGGRGTRRARATRASSRRCGRGAGRPRRRSAAAPCSDHDSATNAVSPSRSVVRARARRPSKPMRRSVVRCSSRSSSLGAADALARW